MRTDRRGGQSRHLRMRERSFAMSRYGKSLAQRSLVRIAPLEPVLWSLAIVLVIWTTGLA